MELLNIIFGHHTKANQSHCIQISLGNKVFHICSRCLGLYPFALLWFIFSLKYNLRFCESLEKIFLYYFFLPLFLDWTLTGLNFIHSNNKIRFITGFLASFSLARFWYLWIFPYNITLIFNCSVVYLISLLIVSIYAARQNVF